MTFDEWLKLTMTVVDFAKLDKDSQHTILLLIDGIKYRNIEANK